VHRGAPLQHNLFRGHRGMHSRATIRGGTLRSGPNRFGPNRYDFKAHITCWFCRKPGHYASACPNRQKFNHWRENFTGRPVFANPSTQSYSHQQQQQQQQISPYPPPSNNTTQHHTTLYITNTT